MAPRARPNGLCRHAHLLDGTAAAIPVASAGNKSVTARLTFTLAYPFTPPTCASAGMRLRATVAARPCCCATSRSIRRHGGRRGCICLSSSYPAIPPCVHGHASATASPGVLRFPLLHPNVFPSGKVDLPLFDNWAPTTTVEDVSSHADGGVRRKRLVAWCRAQRSRRAKPPDLFALPPPVTGFGCRTEAPGQP